MKITSTYSVKIKNYNQIFKPSVEIYRHAVSFYIGICLHYWEELCLSNSQKSRVNLLERLTIRTTKNPNPEFSFADVDKRFYKFPSYLRRAAISEALGKVSSYISNLANWETADKKTCGKKPSFPKTGNVYPALYRENMYVRIDDYTAKIKVFIRNTWDWITVQLRKSDVDYILHHMSKAKECVPTLQKRGKQWFLDFAFEEAVQLSTVPVLEQTVVAVDLGINNACACSCMKADGTILGRKVLSLPREEDSLLHAINRIKKAQQHGNDRIPRLWAKANGINDAIAVKTTRFIIDYAIALNATTIVFEHLDLHGKKKGKSQRQRLQLWKVQRIQTMVEHKAHRLGIRISHVNARNTSKLAFDGSGYVERGTYLQNGKKIYNYSICIFATGKMYHCDLNASYNIGARYFIREIFKSLSVTVRLGIEAKVPQCTKRSTCTLSDLINLSAELSALAA